MSADGVANNNGNIQNNNFIKPLSTDKGTGKVNTAQSKQTINIFSSYDKNTNEVIKGDNETSSISIFGEKRKALENRLNAFTLSENLKDKQINGHTIEDIKNETIKNKMSAFTTMVNNFTFNVGKITKQILVKEGERDQNKLNIEKAGTAQLDNKVDNAAIQKANDTMSKIEEAYKQALDELASKNKGSNVNDKDKIDALSGHNSDKDGNSVVTKTEVFSDYDGNADKHVKYSEVNGKETFTFKETKFGIDTNSEWGQFIDKSSNYDVQAKFDQYAQKFDAKVGSIKVSGDDTIKDIKDKIQEAKSDLNTKATNMAKQFNEEITQKVKTEKFDAIDDAINAAIKDDKKTGGAKFEAFKEAKESQALDDLGLGDGKVTDSDGNNETQLKSSDITNISDVPINTDGKPDDMSDEDYFARKLTETIVNNLFEEGADVGSGSKVDKTDERYESEIGKYKDKGLSNEAVAFMVQNGGKPLYQNGKIVAIQLTNTKDGTKETKTISAKQLEDLIKKNKTQKS